METTPSCNNLGMGSPECRKRRRAQARIWNYSKNVSGESCDQRKRTLHAILDQSYTLLCHGFHSILHGNLIITSATHYVYKQTDFDVIKTNILSVQICVVLGAVLGTIIYRISLVTVFYSGGGDFLRSHAKIFTSTSAAIVNLVIIMILTRVYHRLAQWMVNMENPRTQTEYESSFTFKIFLFEFVNFYSSLIYIAFFKVRGTELWREHAKILS